MEFLREAKDKAGAPAFKPRHLPPSWRRKVHPTARSLSSQSMLPAQLNSKLQPLVLSKIQSGTPPHTPLLIGKLPAAKDTPKPGFQAGQQKNGGHSRPGGLPRSLSRASGASPYRSRRQVHLTSRPEQAKRAPFRSRRQVHLTSRPEQAKRAPSADPARFTLHPGPSKRSEPPSAPAARFTPQQEA